MEAGSDREEVSDLEMPEAQSFECDEHQQVSIPKHR